MVCGVLSPGQLLTSPGECSCSFAKISAVWFVEFSCATVAKSLKEVVANSTCAQSAIAARHGMCRLM